MSESGSSLFCCRMSWKLVVVIDTKLDMCT